MPTEFSDITVDEMDMLLDILSGGVYGAVEQNRLHSATITINEISAQKNGKKTKTNFSAFTSAFLPLKSMREKYPYLKKLPWLLPAAWTQRIFGYLFLGESRVSPSESIRIGNQRIALLREYGIID